jgi:hypothetical protein
MSDALYAEPIPVRSPAECQFYHAMDLPQSGVQEGRWDLRGRFDEYTGGVNFAGKTVLDIGTASGFLTFEAEKRGGSVVSVDGLDASIWERMPIPESLYVTDHTQWLNTSDEQLIRWKKSYWLAHREFNSKAKVHYGNAYALPAELGQFDVVMVGQILVHLPDLVRALTSAADRCADTLVIAEGMVQDEQPVSHFLTRRSAPENNFSFWHHSTGLYQQLMECLDFGLQSNTTAKYRCNVVGWADQIDITTLVFQRGKPSSARASHKRRFKFW